MSIEKSVQPLHKALDAIESIQQALSPFLDVLNDYNTTKNEKRSYYDTTTNKTTPSKKYSIQQVIEAQTAVALSIGTLRYMAARLKGQDKGRNKNDPLRMELDKIRKTLVTLRGIHDQSEKKDSLNSNSHDDKKRKQQDQSNNEDNSHITKKKK
jgi:hypothetical protein